MYDPSDVVLTSDIADQLIAEQGSDVVIPDIYTVIDRYAFFDKGLTSVVIPDSVHAIMFGAFGGNELTSVVIPDSVIMIDAAAFSGCQLESVKIGNGVISIGREAFSGNELKSLSIPDNVQVIDFYAFSGNEIAELYIGTGTWYFDINNWFSPADLPYLEYIYIPETTQYIKNDIPVGASVFIVEVNEAPTALTLSNRYFDENIPGGSVIASLTSADPDFGDTHTYSLVTGEGSADNDAFMIDGDQLIIVDSPDYEAKSEYSIRLQTTDSGGLTYETFLTVMVEDIGPPDVDANGFVDGVTNYQMCSEDSAVALQTRRGLTFSDETSRKWDAIKAVETDYGFSILLEGDEGKDGKYRVVSAGGSGIITGASRWMNESQMSMNGYEEDFNIDFNGNGTIDFI